MYRRTRCEWKAQVLREEAKVLKTETISEMIFKMGNGNTFLGIPMLKNLFYFTKF